MTNHPNRSKKPKWLPIETAPRDGTWVLLAGGRMDDGWYGSLDEPPVAVGFFVGVGGAWAVANWDGDWRTFYEQPTHWTPLPAPPLPEKG